MKVKSVCCDFDILFLNIESSDHLKKLEQIIQHLFENLRIEIRDNKNHLVTDLYVECNIGIKIYPRYSEINSIDVMCCYDKDIMFKIWRTIFDSEKIDLSIIEVGSGKEYRVAFYRKPMKL